MEMFFLPDFEIIKMDAEVSSYQEDFEPEGDGRREVEDSRRPSAEAPNGDASA